MFGFYKRHSSEFIHDYHFFLPHLEPPIRLRHTEPPNNLRVIRLNHRLILFVFFGRIYNGAI